MVFLFLITVVVPAAALGVFGLRALEADRMEMERMLRREQESLNKGVQSLFDSRVLQIHDQLNRFSGITLDQGLPEAREFYMEELSRDTVYRSLVIISSDGSRWWAAQNFFEDRGDRIGGDSPEWERLQAAKRLEFGERELSEAIRVYREVAASAGDELRLAALNSLGRSLAKAGEFADSASTYRSVIESWPDQLDSARAPYFLIAGLRLYEVSKILGREEDAIEALLSVYRKLADGRIRSPEIIEFYSAEYERTLQEACLGNEHRCQEVANIRQALELSRKQIDREAELLDRIAFMAEGLHNLDESRNRLLEIPGSREVVILGNPLSSVENESLLAITILELTELLKQPLESVELAGAGLGVLVSDPHGELVLEVEDLEASSPETTAPLSPFLPGYEIQSFHRRSEAFWDPDYAARNFYIALTIILVAILLVGGFLTFRTVLREAELIRVKGQFVSIVSHEFKSPITSMRTLVERLQSGLVPRPERRQQYLDVIGSELQRLTRLVNNLLDFTKIESGSKNYRKVLTELPELLEDLLETFEPRAKQLGFEIQKKISPDVPRLDVDRDGLAHAVLNLLDNAIKFSLDEKTVQVELQRLGGDVAITVADRGPGISTDEIERIFEPSYRSSLSEELQVPGLGIGLSIVKHVASSHGGRVEVSSSERGSRFTLFLPCGGSSSSHELGEDAVEEKYPKLVGDKRTGTEA